MSFWSSEKLKVQIPQGGLIAPYDINRIKHGCYELSLGPEAFLTSNPDEVKEQIEEGHQLRIPPGQSCLLLTEEHIKIPNNAIGFISIKAGIKFRGLVNISGFHVDPGFEGRLKFAVYNAGSQNIILTRKQEAFLIWFSDLDHSTTDLYDGVHLNQNEISSQDVMGIHGKVHSPQALDQRLTELENTFKSAKTILKTIIGGLILFFLTRFIDQWLKSLPPPSPSSKPSSLNRNQKDPLEPEQRTSEKKLETSGKPDESVKQTDK